MFKEFLHKSEDSKRAARWLFLIGLFTSTKIHLGGSIAIAELGLFLAAPIILSREYPRLRRYGFGPLLALIVLWFLGAVYSDLYNHSYLPVMLKGIATPAVYFTSVVGIFSLLRKDFDNLKWLLLGFAVSAVVSTFFFSRASSLGIEETAESALDRTLGYKLYWVSMASTWILLPIKGWYRRTPMWYVFSAVFGLALYSLLTGARSLFATMMVSFILLILVHRSQLAMKRLARNSVFIGGALLLVLVCAKTGYKYAVKSGFLGEEELHKYEMQTKKGDSAIKMLMAGRGEFFVDIFAAWERPLVGRGSWAIDWDYIYPAFVHKYGDDEAIYKLDRMMLRTHGLWRIPAHSHIATYWMWHGIFALIFWVYFGWIMVSTLKSRLHVIPDFFGYVVLVVPSYIWDLFFSPVGHRLEESVMLVVCLLIRHQDKINKIANRRRAVLS